MWSAVKAIAGCGTDNVKGVEGVGEKRAIQYLTGAMNKESVFYKRIEKSREMIEFNHELVLLPFKGTPVYSVDDDETSADLFLKFCKKYGMKGFMSKQFVDKWEELFCGKQESS
jgi:5'-3' exonuclease